LAGSAIEALLLWKLKQEKPENLNKELEIKARVFDEMTLNSLIEISKTMKFIEQETITLVSLTKDFRNLIHPGRAIRLNKICNRGTAYAALAALEHVVNDLKSPTK